MGIEARFRLELPGFTLDVDLTVPGTGITAIFGHSGSGKTTLLRAIAGLERVEGGRLLVHGDPWQEGSFFLPTHRRPLGYVFQDSPLFSHLSVAENLRYGLRRIRQSKWTAHGIATPSHLAFDPVVDLLGLRHLLQRHASGLSGGERQRIAIARALLTQPRLLLMDEPLAALDLARREEIMPFLERLHGELDIPVLYVSHAPDEVARLADHLVVLDRGRSLASGPIATILSRLDLPIRLGEDVGVVIEASVAQLDREWSLCRVAFPGGSLWVRDRGLAMGQWVRVRVLARDVSIAMEEITGTSIVNSLPATVVELGVESHPALCLTRLDVAGTPFLARLTRRSAAQLSLAQGKQVWIQIKAVALM
ncbi:MAG: molybdenum ABC transporter ATP-binding protein [Magnetococcales bacterium]|nr:molybdenum ABC transporter ATP-binding protein [Magnetococcales bacterium]